MSRRRASDPAATPFRRDRGVARIITGVLATIASDALGALATIGMRLGHSVLSIGSMLCILVAFGATLQLVIEPDFRTPARWAVAIIGFVVGIACGVAQLRLYQRWKHNLS